LQLHVTPWSLNILSPKSLRLQVLGRGQQGHRPLRVELPSTLTWCEWLQRTCCAAPPLLLLFCLCAAPRGQDLSWTIAPAGQGFAPSSTFLHICPQSLLLSSDPPMALALTILTALLPPLSLCAQSGDDCLLLCSVPCGLPELTPLSIGPPSSALQLLPSLGLCASCLALH
jgi:hypothetical protein